MGRATGVAGPGVERTFAETDSSDRGPNPFYR